MTVWEKAILNMQKGTHRIAATAAVISERVRIEITIIRLKIKLDDVQSLIDAQYRIIGRRVVNLKNGEALPKTSEQLVKDEEISSAMTELDALRKERDEIRQEIAHEQAEFKPAEKQEGPSV